MKKFIFLGFPILEFLTALVLISLIGFGWTFVLYLIGFPIGWFVLKAAGRRSLELARMQQAPSQALTFRFIAGALFLIPGLWTDLFALLCFMPLVQRVVARPFMFLSNTSGGVNWRVNTWGNSEIIEGVVIHKNDDPQQQGFLDSAN